MDDIALSRTQANNFQRQYNVQNLLNDLPAWKNLKFYLRMQKFI